MNPLGQMKSTGAADLLNSAATLIIQRGWCRLTHVDHRTGALDVLGALCVAAGAKPSAISDRSDLIASCVPPAKQAAVHVAMEMLEHIMDHDPVSWQYERTNYQCDLINVLKLAALRLQRAISE